MRALVYHGAQDIGVEDRVPAPGRTDRSGRRPRPSHRVADVVDVGLTIPRGGPRGLGPYEIAVNVLAPGPINTEIVGGPLTDERKTSMSAEIPLGRVGRLAEIAATGAFLRFDGAAYINGATIQIDGGRHMP